MQSLFEMTGVHAVVDGQFGSTGKGNFSSFLAYQAYRTGAIAHFDGVVSNAGPNSGHTSMFGQEKIVLKQLPTFAVHAAMMGKPIPAILSAGAVINPEILRAEAAKFPNLPIFVHPNAALITPEDIEAERSPDSTVTRIASTQSGTGEALVNKILRRPEAIVKGNLHDMPPNVTVGVFPFKVDRNAYMMEVSQGFSLGIHSEFYPNVTSRECTVMQGLADARLPARSVAKTYMVVRTYPIRVGNLGEHSSGEWYEDQEEISWDEIAQKPEITTVTGRIRRVATFSLRQFMEAVRANDPDWVAINFLNYMDNHEMRELIEAVQHVRTNFARKFDLVGGFGVRPEHWRYVG